ncbi:MAG: hypothetical protein U5K74_03060 [Gemmatimonadaceae bacterium]|nr:hypothetical protein [Gemmatimonadaceae bacterium]
MQRDPIGSQNDPKFKEYMAAMEGMATAQESGDPAALERAQRRLMALMGGGSDSASIDRAAVPKCGGRPPIPASIVRSQQFKAQADSVEKVARELYSVQGGVDGSEVGMTRAQAVAFWERIMSWLNGMKQDAPITRTFTKEEYDLLVSRRGELRKAFSGAE